MLFLDNVDLIYFNLRFVMNTEIEKFKALFDTFTPQQIDENNRKMTEENQRQAKLFVDHYENNSCYLCGKPFKTISREEPCLHWLLRQCKFKAKDFSLIYKKYGYHNIAAFLRWTANQERLLSNINDLDAERSERKLISYTIKWKNIEWTFDCGKSDFTGHIGTKIEYPHYHFQMRIDGKQFINFNDHHLPFSNEDLLVLNLKESNQNFHVDFGAIGSGMQDAVSLDPEIAIEHMSSSDEEDATYHLSTIIDASENPITGEEINEIMEEAKRTNRSFSYVAQKKLANRAVVKTIISPADSIPDIASRTEHKTR
jgi:hypothetical protein